jgi:hypothetical protein
MTPVGFGGLTLYIWTPKGVFKPLVDQVTLQKSDKNPYDVPYEFVVVTAVVVAMLTFLLQIQVQVVQVCCARYFY